ncbi:MAG: DUF58 domain-containing protein [Vicinamibacterales bacterium]
MSTSLLDPALLNAISDLELVARVTVDGTVSGLHRSPFHGYSAEFSQYRHYQPGDDLKYVDWKLFARTDRIYTKQYRETTNLLSQVAVDASGSMAYQGTGPVSKLAYARLLAAALSHLISSQGDAVGLVTFDAALRTYLPPRGGRLHLRRILVSLSKLQASGGTACGAGLRRAIDLLKRRGLLIFVSDLYDEDSSVEAELRRAIRIGHEVALFHVLTPDELALPFGGDVELEDLETGRRVITSAAARQGYHEAFSAFLERWRTTCASYGIDYHRVTTDRPLDASLRDYLRRRTRSDHR